MVIAVRVKFRKLSWVGVLAAAVVCGTGENLTLNRLQRPVRLNQPGCKPVEQFWMGGPLTGGAEIVGVSRQSLWQGVGYRDD